MDLISAALRTIFYDVNIADVVEDVVKGSSDFLDMDFMHTIKWSQPSFTPTELQSLAHYIKHRIETSDTICRRHGFDVLHLFTDQCLTLSGGMYPEPIARFEYLFQWRELSLLLGEDLLTLSYVARPERNKAFPLPSYAWPNVVRHDNVQLNAALSHGLTDIHAHLKASADVFELTWLDFMHRVVGRKDWDKYKKLHECADARVLTRVGMRSYSPETLIRIAAALRLEVFRSLQTGSIDRNVFEKIMKQFDDSVALMSGLTELQARIDLAGRSAVRSNNGRIVDYAIVSRPNDSIYAIHWGERQLLHRFFYRYFRRDHLAMQIADYVFLYLVIKIRIRREFVQTNPLIGFLNFKTYEGRKSIYANVYSNLYGVYAVQSSIRPGTDDALEARVTPGAVPKNDLGAKLFVPGRRDNVNPGSLTFVVHLIKKDMSDEYPSRLSHREHYRREIEKTLEDWEKRQRISLLSGQSVPYKITGLDAAGSELDCLPETFGHVYRYARQRGLEGLTYHVGEDFYDLADGLRVIDEAICFLGLAETGRLGHATALGVDAETYYEKRNFQVVTSQQRLLDTLVWLRCNTSGGFFPQELDLEARRLYNRIGYVEPYDVNVYYLSQRLRSDDEITSYTGLSPWARTAQCNDDEARVARSIPAANNLSRQYLMDRSIIRRGNEKTMIVYSAEIIDLVRIAQSKLLDKVARFHIGVECNPSSNLKIGPLSDYESHPLFVIRNKGIDTAVGTDDKGIFATSLPCELSLIACAALKRGRSLAEAVALVEQIKSTSKRRRF